MPHPRLLAFAQLLRLPNVFTAFADIALASTVAATILPSTSTAFWVAAGLIALASGCLYLAGMVWNDVFDRAEDAATRPNRPLPSGRIRVRTAIALGVLLFLLGLTFAALAGLPTIGKASDWNHEPLVYAVGITIAVLIYDGGLKRTPIGPVGMGSCRFLNVLFGLSIIPDDTFDPGLRIHLAGVIGVYIVGVTWFARTEEGQSNRRQLIAAASVIALALVLALILKAQLQIPIESGTVLFPYLLVLFAFFVGRPVARAIAYCGPRDVQTAVKRCVLGLVGLDAVLATGFAGWPGLLIVLLLPPALVIGKWVYST
ncbi:MAG TPA: UbiA family prenyltransferase [Gemmata sp.]|nr:UbiA family prenyltransferase [Gemmata sp.]